MNIRKRLTKQERETIWNKYNRRCAYCGGELAYKDMQIDHIIPITTAEHMTIEELNAEENLAPACRQCNFYKGTSSLESFRNDLTNQLMKNLRKNFQFRLAVKHGLITDNHLSQIKFYFLEVENGNNRFAKYLCR